MNIKKETISKLGKHRIVYLSDLWERKDFKTKQELEKITKCKIILITLNFKSFAQTKPMQPKLKGKQQIGKKIFITKNSDKGLITQTYKELNQLYKKKSIHSPIDKWARDMNRKFSDKEIKTINKHMESVLNLI